MGKKGGSVVFYLLNRVETDHIPSTVQTEEPVCERRIEPVLEYLYKYKYSSSELVFKITEVMMQQAEIFCPDVPQPTAQHPLSPRTNPQKGT